MILFSEFVVHEKVIGPGPIGFFSLDNFIYLFTFSNLEINAVLQADDDWQDRCCIGRGLCQLDRAQVVLDSSIEVITCYTASVTSFQLRALCRGPGRSCVYLARRQQEPWAAGDLSCLIVIQAMGRQLID